MPALVNGTKKTSQAGTSMPNQVWPLKESNKWTQAIWMKASRWLFVGISPTSKGFAISKKIRYDRGNKTEVGVRRNERKSIGC